MYLDRQPHDQRGAGLPVALFIITVLALLVLGMSQLQQSTSESVSLQIQSQRAFFAAESGAQIGVGRILADPDNPQCFSESIEFSEAGLVTCRAEITCSVSTGGEIFTLTSEGYCGSGLDEASRTVEVRVR
jgi:MSHA biogenesis protein MshP